MPTITYETSDGTNRITRDDYHTDKDSYVVAYDKTDNGVSRKVTIPANRVVIIRE